MWVRSRGEVVRPGGSQLASIRTSTAPGRGRHLTTRRPWFLAPPPDQWWRTDRGVLAPPIPLYSSSNPEGDCESLSQHTRLFHVDGLWKGRAIHGIVVNSLSQSIHLIRDSGWHPPIPSNGKLLQYILIGKFRHIGYRPNKCVSFIV